MASEPLMFSSRADTLTNGAALKVPRYNSFAVLPVSTGKEYRLDWINLSLFTKLSKHLGGHSMFVMLVHFHTCIHLFYATYPPEINATWDRKTWAATAPTTSGSLRLLHTSSVFLPLYLFLPFSRSKVWGVFFDLVLHFQTQAFLWKKVFHTV